jgi:acyl-coenzyme A synthetase/AMP-(fatty) acid ligase
MNIVNRLYQSFNLFANEIAISEAGNLTTYKTLQQQSLKVASYLLKQNITNSCIAIEINDSTAHIIAILGVIISGNYYVSVTPENKPFFLSENALPVKLIICGDSAKPSETSVSYIHILEHETAPLKLPDIDVITGHTAMCAFFTSGSTGKSKAVIHNHQTIFKDTLRQIDENEMTSADKLDFIFSLSFSASLACIFPALLTGAKLCIFDLKQHGLHQLTDFWEYEAVTFSTLAVSTFQGICKITPSLHHLTALRFISISAEPVKDTTIAFFKSKFSADVILQIAYATTETRTISQIQIHNNDQPLIYPTSIGKPVSGKSVIILDTDGKPLPAGAVGEIIVESEFITDAYWGQPEESNLSFTKKDKIIRYRTGDIGYLNLDGYLFYYGRLQNETKLNGVKINLTNIEEEIENTAAVLQAVVVLNKSLNEQTKLVCFYKSSSHQPLGKDIKLAISSKLPSTHIPQLYIKTDDFPYTHSGKINRKKLEQFDITENMTFETGTPEASAHQDHEALIIFIFKSILNVENINANSNFFDVGGDSLNALLCIAEIKNQLKIPVSTFSLIANSTPRKLSLFLNQNHQKELVMAIGLNEHAKEKPNLYILNYAQNNRYQHFINSPLANQFNLISLCYDLLSSHDIINASQLMLDQLAEIIGKHPNSIVMGHSFDGYIAYQLACIVPQISYCVLIDTYNYNDYEKYQVKHGFKASVKSMLRHTFIYKDYTYPFHIAGIFYGRIKKKKHTYNENFLKGMDSFTANKTFGSTINNCIYFQASRSYPRTKDHGFGWKAYVGGDYHFFNIITDHNAILEKHASAISDHIGKITTKSTK